MSNTLAMFTLALWAVFFAFFFMYLKGVNRQLRGWLTDDHAIRRLGWCSTMSFAVCFIFTLFAMMPGK